MKRLLQKLLMTISVLCATALPVAAPSIAYAQGTPTASKQAVCEGLGSSGCTTTGPSVNDILRLVLNIFSAIVGFIAVIMIIVGGLKYVTSSGDSNNINSAKNTLLYAIIGLVIVALAQIVVKFVLSKVANA